MILIVLPDNQPRNGGNWVYAHRLQQGLSDKGYTIHVAELGDVTEPMLREAEIVHLFNAYRTGLHFLPLMRQGEKPFIVSLTGTDVNEYLEREETRAQTLEVMQLAKRLVSINPKTVLQLRQRYPSLSGRLRLISISVPPQSGEAGGPLPPQRRKEPGTILFFLAAGLRDVKNPLSAVPPLKRLHEEVPEVRLWFAGPAMDLGMERRLRELEKENRDWLRYLGEVPHAEMGAMFQQADVVLNTSRNEGFSHALLEGMNAGRPVLASWVTGNEDLVEHGSDGFLYRSDEEFYRWAKRLAEEPNLRQMMGQRGRDKVVTQFSYHQEMSCFASLYAEVLQKTDPTVCGKG